MQVARPHRYWLIIFGLKEQNIRTGALDRTGLRPFLEDYLEKHRLSYVSNAIYSLFDLYARER